MKRIERVRLYPTPRQARALVFMLDVTRQLYNAALQERKDAYRMRRVSVNFKMQFAELTALRKPETRLDTRLAAVYRECEDAALWRLDLAMAAFFRRYKSGEVPGFPRFKSAAQWKQITFPHGDRALRFDRDQKRVNVPGIGKVKLRKGRVVPAYGRAWVVEKNGRWQACFECERAPQPLPETGNTIGVDRGVHVLAALSDGTLLRNGRHADRHRPTIARHARDLAKLTERDAAGRCTNRRDPKRVAAVRRLARAKEREAASRLDALHKHALAIVRSADVIGIEDLRLRNMTRSAKGTVEEPGRIEAAKSGLNRALLDAALGKLGTLIREKAESAVRIVVGVNPHNSSRECSHCGYASAKNRWRRRFVCLRCGFSTHADVNAASVIRGRAQSALTSMSIPAENAGRRARRAA